MVDRDAMAHGREVFDPIAARACALPGVDIGRMFGTEGLRIRGKVFAFVVHNGSLVVKLHERRVCGVGGGGGGAPLGICGRARGEGAGIPRSAGAASLR